MTVVKICGITDLEQAWAAVEAGADMLGFNFYPPSPRYIASQACASLVSSLRDRLAHAGRPKYQPLLLVGVFVNTPAAEIARIVRETRLDLAQLSGDESPADLAELEGRGYKALHPRNLEAARQEARRFAHPHLHPALLLDAWKPGEYGGTGQTGNWELACAIAREYPILLAGGLNPENVAQAIARVRPWGVDVASGVESAPGMKDAQKIQAFLQAVRAADDLQVP